MDFLTTIASLAIFLILFFMIYGKLKEISGKLDAQEQHYKSLRQQKKPPVEGQSFEQMFKPHE